MKRLNLLLALIIVGLALMPLNAEAKRYNYNNKGLIKTTDAQAGQDLVQFGENVLPAGLENPKAPARAAHVQINMQTIPQMSAPQQVVIQRAVVEHPQQAAHVQVQASQRFNTPQQIVIQQAALPQLPLDRNAGAEFVRFGNMGPQFIQR